MDQPEGHYNEVKLAVSHVVPLGPGLHRNILENFCPEKEAPVPPTYHGRAYLRISRGCCASQLRNGYLSLW
jgi:hypothetical protein